LGYINLPPSLQSLFAKINERLAKLETARRFTMPSTTTDFSSATGRNGDIWLNTTSNTPKYLDATGAVATFGGSSGTSVYYSVATVVYRPDFSTSTTAQSILGSPTFGLTVAAGTTLEFDLQTATRFQVTGTVTGNTGSYQLQADVVSGSPTVTFVQEVDYGNNTTGYAAGMTLSSLSTTASVVFSPSTTTASRFAILKARGVIRVTGTGSVKIYPSLSPSQLDFNDGVNISSWAIANTLFKVTPIGNGTVTSVGAWS